MNYSKGAGQLPSYRKADMHLLFSHVQKAGRYHMYETFYPTFKNNFPNSKTTENRYYFAFFSKKIQ